MNGASATVPSQSAAHGLFDANGRLVPGPSDRVYSQVDRRYFQLLQPPIDFTSMRAKLAEHLGAGSTGELISADELAERCERLRSEVLRTPSIAGVFSGVHVPFVLLPTAVEDLGRALEEQLLPAVGRSFKASFAQYDFRNHLAGQLAGQLSLVAGTRYDRLISAQAAGAVCGWYFPTALTGYAIPDQRALVARMPDSLILSGPIEASMALIGSPGLLMHRDNYPNLLALGAVQPPDPKMFHFFEAYGWNLTYNQRSMVGAVAEYFAGGFTLLC